MRERAREGKSRAALGAVLLAVLLCAVNLRAQNPENQSGQVAGAPAQGTTVEPRSTNLGEGVRNHVDPPSSLNALAILGSTGGWDESDMPVREPLPPGFDAKHPEHMTIAQRLEFGLPVEPKYDLNKIGSRGIGEGMNFYSLEKERVLGMQLSHEVEAQSALINDAVITEYINRIGQNIVRNSDAKVPFVIKVVDNEEINAFALPGGFFYVNTGLILAADNEAELAGVMAHEIAHVAARHITKNATKAQIWNLASIPLIFMGGPAGYAIRQVAGLAVPMTFLKFSRDMEREADLLGLEYQYKSGYDPGAFVQFFERMRAEEKKKHGSFARAFMTHPMNDERVKSAQKEIQQDLPPKSEYVLTTSEFDEVKARLMKLEDEHHIDLGRGSRPTLRRRTHDKGDSGGGEKKDDPPVLRKRTERDQGQQPTGTDQNPK
jgi:hypothetical protein